MTLKSLNFTFPCAHRDILRCASQPSYTKSRHAQYLIREKCEMDGRGRESELSSTERSPTKNVTKNFAFYKRKKAQLDSPAR